MQDQMRGRHAKNNTVKPGISMFPFSGNYLKPLDAPGQMDGFSFSAWV